MHSRSVIIGTLGPTGMPHRVAQQPTVQLCLWLQRIIRVYSDYFCLWRAGLIGPSRVIDQLAICSRKVATKIQKLNPQNQRFSGWLEVWILYYAQLNFVMLNLLNLSLLLHHCYQVLQLACSMCIPEHNKAVKPDLVFSKEVEAQLVNRKAISENNEV